MVTATIKHRDHKNITTFIDGQQINLRNHIGHAPLELAAKLIEGPFGYEWGEPVMPFNKNTWTKDYRKIIWNHIMPYYEGYGYVAQMMIWALKDLGVDVSIFYKPEMYYLKRDIMDIVHKPRQYDAWSIWHHFWMKPGMLPTEKRALYTMWESTQLNMEWPGACNEVDLVLVPCQQNVEIFQNNGVKKPIKVLQHGVDQEFYFYREKQKKDIFTVGTVGSLVPRKDPELLIKAFLDEFHNNDDVLLYMKDTNEETSIREQYGQNPKIKFNGQKISPYEMGELLASFDIAAFPSHGEGFGLGGLQAMGVGTTCICTNWGGFREYLNPEYNFALDYEMVKIDKVPSNNTFYSGEWAQASYEHLRKLLRYAYEHRDEIHQKGKKAAEWVKNYWTWQRCGQQLIDAIDEYEQIGT